MTEEVRILRNALEVLEAAFSYQARRENGWGYWKKKRRFVEEAIRRADKVRDETEEKP